jgi:hypothetical protein
MTTPDAPDAERLLEAMARVEASLAVVLVHIAEIQREVARRPPLHHDRSPLRPDDSWAGTP